MGAIVPVPRVPIAIRVATSADLAFIDALQKANSKCVGFFKRAALEQKIALGQILIAESKDEGGRMKDEGGRMKDEGGRMKDEGHTNSSFIPHPSSFPLGYCIFTDRYFKRDDCGIIYQLNVVPTARRQLVGAALIQAVFERASYACRLFCLWCAQDIDANRFWEALGFVPLAFRAGSRGKGRQPAARIHIFWQKRVRAQDATTPLWFPSHTSGGALSEGRIVLPIPPGVHWADAMPVVVPQSEGERNLALSDARTPAAARELASAPKPLVVRPRYVQFGAPGKEPPAPAPEPAPQAKVKAAKKPRLKNDPAHIAAARDLNARYMEQYNAAQVLPNARYDVVKQIETAEAPEAALLLEQAA